MKAWFLLAVFILTLTASLCRSAEEPHVYPVPLAELVYLISDWLADSGMQLHQEKTDQGLVRIQGNDSSGKWEVSLEPRSALSTAVTVHYEKIGNGGDQAPDLYKYLEQYPMNAPLEDPLQNEAIPQPILDVADSAVCLYSVGEGETIEFSGFFIDNEVILSTAHGLHEQQTISVLTSNGVDYKGDIQKLDFDRDLALIRIHGRQERGIALETGRNILHVGEKVFSAGCSANRQGAILAGTINSPPRRVGQHPLWQVYMEINPGRSGSPVFDEHGAIVAVVKGRYRGTETMGFLIPLETIMDFLNAYFAECNTDDIK